MYPKAANFMIQYAYVIRKRETDIVLIENESKLCWIINILCTDGNTVYDKEERNAERYDSLV